MPQSLEKVFTYSDFTADIPYSMKGQKDKIRLVREQNVRWGNSLVRKQILTGTDASAFSLGQFIVQSLCFSCKSLLSDPLLPDPHRIGKLEK